MDTTGFNAATVLGISVADVKQAMGFQESNTAYDSFIEGVIRTKADLLVEDNFTSSELRDFTPNQKRRAVIGLSYLLAADCLMTMPMNQVMSSGDQVVVGPIELSGWSGTRGISDIRQVAQYLRTQGEEILRTLHLTNDKGTLPWGAVGTVKRPTYVGGPRYGIRYGHH